MTVWLVGGLDPTGGAGVLRDFATLRAVAPTRPCRVAVTALTRQGHGRPADAEAVTAETLSRQLASFPRPAAVKIGLCPDVLVEPLVRALAGVGAPMVVDPVLRASDGGELGATPPGLLPLLRRATVVTPNRLEAESLVGPAEDDDALVERVARSLGGPAVLLKGGHGTDAHTVTDRLWHAGGCSRFARPRQAGPDPRGTGCALATALAEALARERGVVEAAAEAIAWLDRARAGAITVNGDGVHLPVGASDSGAPR